MPADIALQIERWRGRLLDTSKRNPLINFSTGRSGGIRVHGLGPRPRWPGRASHGGVHQGEGDPPAPVRTNRPERTEVPPREGDTTGKGQPNQATARLFSPGYKTIDDVPREAIRELMLGSLGKFGATDEGELPSPSRVSLGSRGWETASRRGWMNVSSGSSGRARSPGRNKESCESHSSLATNEAE